MNISPPVTRKVLEGYEHTYLAVHPPTEKRLLANLAPDEAELYSKSACHGLVDCKINEYLTTCNQESPRRL